PAQGDVLEVAKVVPVVVLPAGGGDGVPGAAERRGEAAPRLACAGLGEGVCAGAGGVRPVAAGVGADVHVHSAHQDDPVFQSLVARILHPVAVMVLALDPAQRHILEVTEVLPADAHPAAGGDRVPGGAVRLGPAGLVLLGERV